ncbi:MAG: metallophosphoesterase family protein [Actinobacteria bacterium]|nr:metallophosphoesterase family protein [Actinomycetota bacterium]
MRVAVLNDIHGNLPALEAVLAEVEHEGVDAIVSGGDVVWGPLPAECLELLVARGAHFVRGNADRDVLTGQDEVDRFCAPLLNEGQMAHVGAWPLTVELDVDDVGRVLFCHATPRSDEEIVTKVTPDSVIAELLSDVTADLVVCGHTHVQFDRAVTGAPRLVNAGSVGMPYEGDPDARWALLGPDIELRRTPYDVEAAIAELVATGMPGVERIVVRALRGEVAPDDAVRFFESQRGA